jgi:hypothetical protein
MKFARDILNKLPYSDQELVASTIESLYYIQEHLQQRDQTTEPPASEAKLKNQRPRSPKASAKQPTRKNPVRKKGTRRSKPRGKG